MINKVWLNRSDTEQMISRAFGVDQMSRRTFYFVIGGIIAWGFLISTIVIKATSDWQPELSHLLIILVIPIIGICMSKWGKNPFLVFLGFNMVFAGFSALTAPGLSSIEISQPEAIARATAFTALVTFSMGISGFLFPNLYSKIGGMLFRALMSLVVISFVRKLIPGLEDMKTLEYISTLIFSLYIGYDMYRASQILATWKNSVDVAVSLYLDIYITFVNIMNISEESSESESFFSIDMDDFDL